MAARPPADVAKSRRSHSPPAAHDAGKRHALLVDIGGKIVFSAVFALLAWAVNKTSAGEDFELFTYRLLQRQLKAPEQLPVTVIDISELRPEQGITPRKPLRNLLQALSDMGESAPKVIGVDVDLSPEVDNDGKLKKFVDPGDPALPDSGDLALYEFCKVVPAGVADYSKHMHVPTLLGVFRTQALPPERWLVSSRFKQLGASLWLPERPGVAVASVYSGEQVFNKPPNGPTLSAALAAVYREDQVGSAAPTTLGSSALNWFFPIYSNEEITSGLTLGESMINYSVVERLQRERIVLRRKAYDNLDELRDDLDLRQDEIQRHMVLLGDIQAAAYQDVFPDPAHDKPIPGVLIHAAAAFTQAERPLRIMNRFIRLLMDILLALFGLTIQTLLIIWLGERVHHEKLETVITIAMVVGVLLFGVLINSTHILWDDFLFVAILLAIHPVCHRVSTKGWNLFHGWLVTKEGEAQ
jgi:CHASE2 domain-containing sensor protein